MSIRTAVVDDDAWVIRSMARFLAEQVDVELVGTFTDEREALNRLPALRPDLLFLDVRMPRRSGFDLLDSLRPACDPLVVVVTAYDHYATRAFDMGVVDYLLKPFTSERLCVALARVRERILQTRKGGGPPSVEIPAPSEPRGAAESDASLDAAATPASRPSLSRIPVREGERIRLIDIRDIVRFQSAGNYVKVVVRDREYLIRATLAGLEKALDANRFCRIHRTTIINLDYVDEFRPWFGGDYVVRLRDGSELRLSRRYRDRVLGGVLRR